MAYQSLQLFAMQQEYPGGCRNNMTFSYHSSRQWYTSGIREEVSSMQQSLFIWQGVGSLVSSGLSFWNEGVNKNESNGVIVYGIGGESLLAPEAQISMLESLEQ